MILTQFKNISTILRRINTYKSFDVARIIYNNNYFYFYSKNILGKDIIDDELIGGAKVKTTKFKYKNNTFNFEETTEDNLVFIKIHSFDGMNECIFIIIDKSMNIAILQSISNFPECVKGNLTQGGIGSLLLQVVIKFLKTYKDNYEINKIVLKDNSHKTCPNYGYIDLSSLYFLTKGDTWYGKYGFKPYDSTNEKPDKVGIKQYKKNQEIINNILLKDVPQIKSYIINACKKLNMYEKNCDQLLTIYNKYIKQDTKLKNFLKDFVTYYNKTCSIFKEFYKELENDIGLIDFNGRSFYLDL